jgi:putative ABC transport system permease protein
MRFVLAGLAIAIGVALAFAVHVINRSAAESFGQAVRGAAGGADLQVRGASALGFDEGLYPQLMAHSVVADASPVVQLRATIGERALPVTLLGLDMFRTVTVSPSLVMRPRSASAGAQTRSTDLDAVLDQDALYLSRSAMIEARLNHGDRVEVRANGRAHNFVVAGDLPGVAQGQRIAVVDIASAQWRFGRLGTLDRVDLKLESGITLANAKAKLSPILPGSAQLSDAETESRRSEALSRAYRVNLDMLALVALLTGGFLVYSAQSLAVTRRLRQFALLRTLGLQKRALAGQLIGEGAILGTVGALIGLAGGYVIAGFALRLVGGDLGAGYFDARTTTLEFAPEAQRSSSALASRLRLLGATHPPGAPHGSRRRWRSRTRAIRSTRARGPASSLPWA